MKQLQPESIVVAGIVFLSGVAGYIAGTKINCPTQKSVETLVSYTNSLREQVFRLQCVADRGQVFSESTKLVCIKPHLDTTPHLDTVKPKPDSTAK